MHSIENTHSLKMIELFQTWNAGFLARGEVESDCWQLLVSFPGGIDQGLELVPDEWKNEIIQVLLELSQAEKLIMIKSNNITEDEEFNLKFQQELRPKLQEWVRNRNS